MQVIGRKSEGKRLLGIHGRIWEEGDKADRREYDWMLWTGFI